MRHPSDRRPIGYNLTKPSNPKTDLRINVFYRNKQENCTFCNCIFGISNVIDIVAKRVDSIEDFLPSFPGIGVVVSKISVVQPIAKIGFCDGPK